MMQVLEGKKFVIAGGSGFLGSSLASHLSQHGASVVILSRRAPTSMGSSNWVGWDGRTLGQWQTELNNVDGLVNLTGRSVDCIKTPEHCDEILRSRVESTHILGKALRCVDAPPPVWVQMSTAHIYGDPPQIVCSEESPLGYGLAPYVGRHWEAAFRESLLPSQRGVVFRTGFVLGRERGAGGGALSTLRLLTRLGLGGRVGNGMQGMSWIHEKDMNRLFERALIENAMTGVYVATAPNPVAQFEFMRELRRVTRIPIGLPAPEWLVRLGTYLVLRADAELALYGRYVVSKRLESEGFQFEYPELPQALHDLLDS